MNAEDDMDNAMLRSPDLIWLWPDGDRSRGDTDPSYTRQIGLFDHPTVGRPVGEPYRDIAYQPPLAKRSRTRPPQDRTFSVHNGTPVIRSHRARSHGAGDTRTARGSPCASPYERLVWQARIWVNSATSVRLSTALTTPTSS